MATLRQRKNDATDDSTNSAESPKIRRSSKKFFHPLIFIPVVFRLIVAVIFMVFTLPILWLLLPLRPLHPLFRKIGIQNNKLPLDLVQKYWAVLMTKILEIKIIVEGEENVPKDQALVLMYSHASNLDAFLLMSCSPVAVKFVFKKSLLFTAPFLFPLARLYGHIPIDRKNRESAINSLINAGKMIKRYKRSVCIAPEGTRSTTGKLQEFKKGPFHLSKGSDVSIVPVVIFNNFQLWPPGQILPYCGEVRVRILPAIVPTKDDTVDTLSVKVKESMQKGLDENIPDIQETPETMFNAVIFFCLYVAIWYFVRNYIL